MLNEQSLPSYPISHSHMSGAVQLPLPEHTVLSSDDLPCVQVMDFVSTVIDVDAPVDIQDRIALMPIALVRGPMIHMSVRVVAPVLHPTYHGTHSRSNHLQHNHHCSDTESTETDDTNANKAFSGRWKSLE